MALPNYGVAATVSARPMAPLPKRAPKPRAVRPVAAEGAGLREQRGARRKRETRTRLLDAAFELMAARGADGVTIHEITEAADVATGGFYNHFGSKEDVYFELTKRVFEDYADGLEVLLAGVDDPAEVVAVSVRQTVARAAREPVWGQFLLREGLSSHAWTRGLGSRLRRDIGSGVKRGRFKLNDPVMTFVATGGAILAAVAAQVHAAQAPHDAAAATALTLGKEDVGERIATIVLQMLGLSASQAERVARKPLPATRAA
jgi:AcrR family transcriptional regulator